MTQPGTMLSLELKGGQAAAFRFLNALELITISNNLGDAKSIITHPATTTHQRLSEDARAALGITPGLVRLSVGLEDAGDLIADLTQALEAADEGPSDPALPAEDAAHLARVFHRAVRRSTGAHYSLVQRMAWSPRRAMAPTGTRGSAGSKPWWRSFPPAPWASWR
jgi:hypothetical protein